MPRLFGCAAPVKLSGPSLAAQCSDRLASPPFTIDAAAAGCSISDLPALEIACGAALIARARIRTRVIWVRSVVRASRPVLDVSLRANRPIPSGRPIFETTFRNVQRVPFLSRILGREERNLGEVSDRDIFLP